MSRPEPSEYAPYFDRYISLVTATDIVAALGSQQKSTRALLNGITEETSHTRYEAGKWSIKELTGHIIDTERVFAYRALRFARNDATPLAGFDQETFAANAGYSDLPFKNIIEEYEAVRTGTVLLFKHLDRDAWNRRGSANGNEITVHAIAFVIAGHEQHHVNILKDRYL